MGKVRWPAAALSLALLGLSGGFFFLGAQAFTEFLPPRTAVVDIAQVFKSYDKSEDREKELLSTAEGLTQEIDQLKSQREILEVELKDLKPGTSSFGKKYLEGLEINEKLKTFQNTKWADFQKQREAFVREIHEEIKREIKVLATAEELDLVLEKSMALEDPRGGARLEWAIVHFARPEYDLTQKVIERLNERYRRP